MSSSLISLFNQPNGIAQAQLKWLVPNLQKISQGRLFCAIFLEQNYNWCTLFNYASVDGAPRHTVVVACVCRCVYVFHAHFSATAKN